MKVRSRLKRPARVTSYQPPKKIVLSTTQLSLLEKLEIPLQEYSKVLMEEFGYKRRYK